MILEVSLFWFLPSPPVHSHRLKGFPVDIRWKRGSIGRRMVAHRRGLLWLGIALFALASLRTALGLPVLMIAALGLYLAYDRYVGKRSGAIAVPWQLLTFITSQAARRNYLIGEAVASRIPHVHPQSVLSDDTGFLILADDIPLELIGRALRALLRDRARLRRAVLPRPSLVNHTLGGMLVLAVLMTVLGLVGRLALWGLPAAVVLGKLLARRMNRPALNLLLLYTRFPAMAVESVFTVNPREFLGYPVPATLVGCRVELKAVRQEARVGWMARLRGRFRRASAEPLEEARNTLPESDLSLQPDSQVFLHDSPSTMSDASRAPDGTSGKLP